MSLNEVNTDQKTGTVIHIPTAEIKRRKKNACFRFVLVIVCIINYLFSLSRSLSLIVFLHSFSRAYSGDRKTKPILHDCAFDRSVESIDHFFKHIFANLVAIFSM